MEIIFKNGFFVASGAVSFEQSKWLGDNGFWFYGRRSNARTASKMRAAGIPINSRYIPADRSEAIAHLVNAPGLDWSAEALAAVRPKAEALAASWASDSDFSIPAPDGLAYRPYQRAGVSFAMDVLKKRHGVIIGDEMGLGKTMQAIGVAAILNPESVLICCPASLRTNWAREVEKWLPSLRGAVHVIESGDPIPATARVVIVNYDKAVGKGKNPTAVREALAARTWALTILDEAHMLKNPKAQRTQFFLGEYKRDELVREGIVHRSPHILLLTGTPIQNKVRESVTLLRAAGCFGAGSIFRNEGDFLFRYCGALKGFHGWTFDGSTNLQELNAKLRAGGAMIRRLKVDVATELPPKLRGVVTLPYNGQLRRDKPASLAKADFADAVRGLTTEIASFEELSRERAALAKAKADQVVDHVRTMLDGNGKVIVFGHHQTLLDALTAAFGSEAIRIDGKVDPNERQALVDAFQNQEQIRVAILSTHAAGVGLTLTAASTVIFGEADWNPSWAVQAEDRAHRIGQAAEHVTVQYLVLDGTLDAHVISTMVSKMEIADQVLDQRKVATPAPVAPPPAPPVTPRGERSVTIKAGTYKITDDIKAAAAEGLLFLSGRCDGARKQDDVGFNGRDAHSDFVQDLVNTAAARGLSDKQAAWALKILTTYKNTQLAHLAGRLFPS